jgi:hypothetical protein
LAIWTRLDILLACVVLAQYQSNTGHEHFEALKHLIGYLRRNPDDIPLTYCQQHFDASVSLLDIQMNFADPMNSEVLSSTSYHGVDSGFISRTNDLFVASTLIFETKEVRQVLPVAKRGKEIPLLPDESTVDQDIADFPESFDVVRIDQLPKSSGLPRRSTPYYLQNAL